ncbi:MAG: hypothetical protein Q8922_13890 [Bacteroidota bacterium]|nr:hypothetical protein [Bacteroidota bacterium]MDP4232350.1 hypothetical protein [Bacteroidota bacterium]MDP4241489.1 hypothetical protein [Bacteroidota bacterium]MDP4289014.1 hypothetical protein [Bacteroidota bacterium]
MTARQCPVCMSLGTLSPSHRRSSHETFLAVIAPFAYPYRCSACNWRGMMGRTSLMRHAKLNLAVNATLYGVLLVGFWNVFILVRNILHPT